MPLFNAISPLNGGGFEDYYNDREYPFDLNGALDYTRPKTGQAHYPYPQTIGYINGCIPLFDQIELLFMLGYKGGGGSTVDILSNPILQPGIFPDISGGMRKRRG